MGRQTRSAAVQARSNIAVSTNNTNSVRSNTMTDNKTKKTSKTDPGYRRRKKLTGAKSFVKHNTRDQNYDGGSFSQAHSMLAATTFPDIEIQVQARLLLTRAEAIDAETRRRAMKETQAAQNPSLTELEPDLNSDEVQHFEVDKQGSLTFILFDTKEAWQLEEVDNQFEGENLQMIVGRCYRVRKL